MQFLYNLICKIAQSNFPIIKRRHLFFIKEAFKSRLPNAASYNRFAVLENGVFSLLCPFLIRVHLEDAQVLHL